MTITERARRDLYDQLEQALGPEHVETLMQLLPHQPADELVTISYFQTEMAAHRAEIARESAELRTELKGEMSELKGEMSELRGELAELRGEVRGLAGEIRSEIRTEISALNVAATRRLAGMLATNVIAVVSTALIV